MMTQLKRYCNFDLHLKNLFYFVLNWAVYPLISRAKSGPRPELDAWWRLQNLNCNALPIIHFVEKWSWDWLWILLVLVRLSQLAHLRERAPLSKPKMNAHKEFRQREGTHFRVLQKMYNSRACLTIRATTFREQQDNPSHSVGRQAGTDRTK